MSKETKRKDRHDRRIVSRDERMYYESNYCIQDKIESIQEFNLSIVTFRHLLRTNMQE
jgi:hypothetical protein